MPFFLHFGLTIFITKLGNYFSSKEARLDRYLYAKGKFSFEVTAKVSVEENSFGEGAGEMLLGGSVLKKYLLRLSQESGNYRPELASAALGSANRSESRVKN